MNFDWRVASRTAASVCALVAAGLLAGCERESAESLIKAGEALAAKDDPVAASIQFKSALQLKPDEHRVRVLLSRSLLASGDATSAIVELSKAREQGQSNDEVVPLLARALMASAEHKRLVTLLDSVRLDNPQAQASLKTSLAAAWMQLGNRAKADAALAQALAAQPMFGAARVMQAQALAESGKVDGALALLDAVLRDEPKLVDAWHAKGELLAYAKKDTPGGQAAFNQAKLLDRFYAPAYAALAGLSLNEKDFKAATAQAAALRKVLPRHPQANFIDAFVDLQEGRQKEARDKMQGLLRIASDNVGVLILAGMVEGMSGSFVVAESHFVKALTIDPKQVVVRRSLALTYLNLGQAMRAMDVLKPLIGADSVDAPSLAMAGEAALRLGNARAAEALFEQASKLDPNDTYVSTSLAVSQLRRGNFDQAFADLGTLSRGDSKRIVADMALISARIARAEWPEALAAIDVAMAKAPNDPALFGLRGRVLASKGDLAGARVAFEKAVAINPAYFAATADLAAVDLLEKKPEAAALRMQQALKADPRNSLAGLAWADLLAKTGAPLAEQQRVLSQTIAGNPAEARPHVALVELNLRNKRAREALQVAQDAVAALPNDPAVLDALARAQTVSGDTQQAISTYRRMSNLVPKDLRTLQRLAELYRSTGDRKNAENVWRRIAELDPAFPGVQGRIVDLLATDKKPATALAEAKAMQQNNADSVIGFIYESVVHLRARAPDKAAETLRNGLTRNPSSADLAIRLYQAMLAQGRKDDAARLAERWPKEHPQDSEFELELANSHLVGNDPAAAEKVLRSLVARHPERPLPLNNLAYVLAVQKKPGAVGFAERALAQAAENAAMLDTYATALAAEGQAGRALDVQRRAVNLAPDDPGLRLNLARVAIAAGDKPLARTELDALGAAGGDSPLGREVEKLRKLL